MTNTFCGNAEKVFFDNFKEFKLNREKKMPSLKSVYLDYNATTPLDPRVLAAMLPFFHEKFGNAASKSHRFGWEAEEAVEKAKEQIANLIGARSKEIIFTSGATESNNLAFDGLVEANEKNRNHIVSATTEHKAVLDPIERLGGMICNFLPVNAEGLVSLDQLSSTTSEGTLLVSIMLGNNETGTIPPFKEISEIAKKHGAYIMTDATQAVGKIPVDVDELEIDLMSFSAHKMYGPKGVGVLFVRSNPKVELSSQIQGGGHQRGLRSGTLNVPGIVGFGAACELCGKEMAAESKRLDFLRNKLEDGLLKISGTHLNGSKESRLSHVSNISFEGLVGEQLTLGLNDVAVSHGSACTSATIEPSHVLKAMGLSDELALSSLRFSLGRFTTEDEIDFTIKRVTQVVDQLRTYAI